MSTVFGKTILINLKICRITVNEKSEKTVVLTKKVADDIIMKKEKRPIPMKYPSLWKNYFVVLGINPEIKPVTSEEQTSPPMTLCLYRITLAYTVPL